MQMERLLIGAAVVAASACSSGVKPIGLHDSDVPLDARRFVADAQDAVSIARARRDDAVIELRATEGWRTELTNTSMWPKGSEGLLKKLEIFADARVKMANLLLARAELQLELAKSKYTLSTAETAMRNDIAVYDLKPLRDDTEGIRREIERANVNVEDQRTSMDKLTLAWWEAYGAFTQGGKDTPVFYISPEILASAKERDERMKATRKAKAKSGETAEKESGEKALPKTTEKKDQDAKSQPKEEKLELDL
jgi:hypothetical protein